MKWRCPEKTRAGKRCRRKRELIGGYLYMRTCAQHAEKPYPGRFVLLLPPSLYERAKEDISVLWGAP